MGMLMSLFLLATKTVGHTSSADIQVTSPGEQTAIALALATYRDITLLKDGTDYQFTHPLMLPTDTGHCRLVGQPDGSGNLPKIKFSVPDSFAIRSTYPGNNCEIAYLEFDLCNTNAGTIGFFYHTATLAEVHHCKIHSGRRNPAAAAMKGEGVQSQDAQLYFHDNEAWDYEDNIIRVFGWGVNKVRVENNYIHDCPNYGPGKGGGQKIAVSNAIVKFNKIENCKAVLGLIDEFDDGAYEYDIVGIYGGAKSTVERNTIIGCREGVWPGESSLVKNNVCLYNDLGIDFWYSTGCTIDSNECYDNGQKGGEGCWDRAGIDIADHSANSVVTNNRLGNRSDSMYAALTANATVGQKYIVIDNMYGHRSPYPWGANQLIGVAGETNKYRIDRVDTANKILYLMTGLAQAHSTGQFIWGIAKQPHGIGIGDNLQSAGGHYVAGNIYGHHTYCNIGEPSLQQYWSPLPNSYYEGYIYPSRPDSLPTRAIGKTIQLTNGQYWMWTVSGWVQVGTEETQNANLKNQKLKIRPNPFINYTSIPGYEKETFSIVDITGREVNICKGNKIGEKLPSGIYFVRQLNSANNKLLRIVKVK